MAMQPMGSDVLDEGATPAGEADLGQGYVIELTCKSDGTFAVSAPEPVQAEGNEENAAGGEQGSDQVYPDIGAALAAIQAAVQSNPVGNEQQQVATGYARAKGRPMMGPM